MAEQPSSDTGWLKDYIPPSKHPRLFAARYCPGCGVADICGEHNRETACGDPSEYDADDFHPATTSKQSLVQELRILPPPVTKWVQPELPTALTVATDPRPLEPERFAVGAPAVLRLTKGEGAGRIGLLVGSDKQIHKFWLQQGSLGRTLRNIGYSAVIAPAYSTWWRGAPLEGLVSMNRSMSMIRYLNRHVPVIPTVGWRTGKDIERWCEWLRVGPSRVVAVHFGNRTVKAWQWNLKGIRAMRQLLAEDTRLVVIGPSTTDRIEALARVWGPDLSIVSQRPWQVAQQGRQLNPELKVERASTSKFKVELAQENAKRFRLVAEGIIKRRGLRAV